MPASALLAWGIEARHTGQADLKTWIEQVHFSRRGLNRCISQDED